MGGAWKKIQFLGSVTEVAMKVLCGPSDRVDVESRVSSRKY